MSEGGRWDEADEEQAVRSVAAERDEAAGRRDSAAARRDQDADRRDGAGAARDQAADRRDDTADQRDDAADKRDKAADRRDRAAEHAELDADFGISTIGDTRALARREAAFDRNQASLDRRAGASERSEAEHDRDSALADRSAGASERTEAEHDRDTALTDRGASEKDRTSSAIDGLTEVYVRADGLVELEREIVRAKRTAQPLVVAFADVDRLKATNDAGGHAAGDRMLRDIAQRLRAALRSYDLIIRYGGDEFVCALSGLSMADAIKRFALVNATLANTPDQGSITVGFAQLQPDDTADDLIARADTALYQERQQNPRTHP